MVALLYVWSGRHFKVFILDSPVSLSGWFVLSELVKAMPVFAFRVARLINHPFVFNSFLFFRVARVFCLCLGFVCFHSPGHSQFRMLSVL